MLVSALSSLCFKSQKRGYLFVYYFENLPTSQIIQTVKIRNSNFSQMYTEFWFCGILIGIAGALIFRVSALFDGY